MSEASRLFTSSFTALIAVLAVALPGSTRSAHAEEPDSHAHDAQPAPDRSAKEVLKDIWTRDKLSGDWGGLRTDLTDHGIDIDLRLLQFYQGVASGGVNTNGEYGASMDYRVNVDGKKLIGLWEGVSVQLHANTRFGEDISADAGAFALANATLLYPLPGDYSDSDITGLTITQSLFDGRLDAFFGKLNAVDLVTGIFPQVASGQDGFWNVNALVTALPWFRFVNLSQWGGGFWTIKDEQIEHGTPLLCTVRNP